LKCTVQIVKKFHAPDLHHVVGVTLLENYLRHIASAITQINGSHDIAICISHNLHLHDFLLIHFLSPEPERYSRRTRHAGCDRVAQRIRTDTNTLDRYERTPGLGSDHDVVFSCPTST